MTKLLLDQGLPVDGIVCYNDQIAVGVVHVLREMGEKCAGGYFYYRIR